MNRDTTILNIALQQGGVVRRDQALRSGFNDGTIGRRISSGAWQRMGHGGYRLIELPGRLNLVRAAVSVLPNAVVSHNSAAAIHRLPLVPTDVATVSVHSRTTHTFPGVEVFRNHDLRPDHVTTIHNLPITSPARTVIDLASILSPRHLAAVVDHSIADDAYTLDDLQAILEAVARSGKPGVRNMRKVLEDRIGGPRNGTILERRGLALLRQAGLDGFIQEFPIPWDRRRRFDLALPADQLAIEWDSRRWHMQVEAMRRDRERDREAIEHGWRILRFTWADVHDTPNMVIDTVRSVTAA